MLELSQATVRYNSMTLPLPDISLQRGERLGLSGRSGSGKSTLARILSGHLSLTEGNLIAPAGVKGKANPVQWIGQQPALAFNPKWRIQQSLDEAYQEHDFTDKLAQYRIQAEWLTRYPHQLSGGELQRLNIVRALPPTTSFLICDEITAQLDPLTQKSIWQQLLFDADKRHLGLLIISHQQSLLDKLCHRIISLPE